MLTLWLGPRWRKIWRDLWFNKTRTVLVVLSIAVGVFAVGTIAASQIILSRDLKAAYLATHPAHATILSIDSFDDNLVKAVAGMREVAEAEPRRRVSLRIKIGSDESQGSATEWRVLWLIAIPDFNEIKVDQFWPEQGAWPPPDHEMLIERAALGLAQAQVGDTVTVKTADGKERQMRIAGLAHDLNAQMYVFDGVVYGFTTFDTLEWLGQAQDYNELRIVVANPPGRPLDREYIQQVANKVRDKFEASGRSVFFTFVPEPGKPMLDFLIQAISIILGALGIMSLLLSGFLVINTISALLMQQTRQIGMMKAVGARRPQLMGLYLTMVLVFGLLSLVIAVPIGVLGAHVFTRYIASFLNFDLTNLQLPLPVLLTQVAVGLLVPLAAALYPVFMGTRVTVREAISSYGLGKGQFGSNRLDRWLVGAPAAGARPASSFRRYFSRPLLLSLRNTFRRKGRLALTLITLTLAGAIFIAVFSVRASLLGTLDHWLDYYQYDVAVQFNRDYRVERVLRETLNIPGVVNAETWGFYNTRRQRPDGSESDNIILFAPPADTRLVKPSLVTGRWLRPGEQNTVVVSTITLRDEPDLQVGDDLVLKIDGREHTFRVVGFASGGALMSTVFISYPDFARVAHEVGRAEWVFATTEQHDFDFQQQVARALEQRFEHVGLGVDIVAMVAQERAETEAIFEVIVVLLMIMAVLLAVIGGLGLMGTMSINVLERTREIGVMRAIGASNGAVRRVFVVEGIIVGILSWVVGAILAYPMSKLLSDAVGKQFLSTPLDYTFSINGMLLWLVVVILLAALASFLPAWNASRLTVREVLAYE